MSKYTTELRYICEEQAGRTESVDYNSTASVIEAARSHIFNFTYPYYDADQKQRTETNILRHFYTMEIGEETYGLWKMRLEDRMNLIMPYYVKMFETAALEFDPLVDVDLRETLDEDTAAHSEGSSNVTNSSVQNDNNSSEVITDQDDSVNRTHSAFNSDNRSGNDETKNKYSDTPQGSITNLENDKYLTNASINNSESTEDSEGVVSEVSGDVSTHDVQVNTTGDSSRINTGINEGSNSSNDTGTRNYEKLTKGKTAGRSYSEMVEAYRNTILRIDSMICDELSDLFMLIW